MQENSLEQLCGKSILREVEPTHGDETPEPIWLGICKKPVDHKTKCGEGCEQCDHMDIIPVAESVLDAVHGFTRRLCRCCLVRENENALDKCIKVLLERRKDLKLKPCS